MSTKKAPPSRVVLGPADPQMAHPEHLRSIGTLVDPFVKLPPMTTAEADMLESALTGVRRDQRNKVMEEFLTKP